MYAHPMHVPEMQFYCLRHVPAGGCLKIMKNAAGCLSSMYSSLRIDPVGGTLRGVRPTERKAAASIPGSDSNGAE